HTADERSMALFRLAEYAVRTRVSAISSTIACRLLRINSAVIGSTSLTRAGFARSADCRGHLDERTNPAARAWWRRTLRRSTDPPERSSRCCHAARPPFLARHAVHRSTRADSTARSPRRPRSGGTLDDLARDLERGYER